MAMVTPRCVDAHKDCWPKSARWKSNWHTHAKIGRDRHQPSSTRRTSESLTTLVGNQYLSGTSMRRLFCESRLENLLPVRGKRRGLWCAWTAMQKALPSL